MCSQTGVWEQGTKGVSDRNTLLISHSLSTHTHYSERFSCPGAQAPAWVPLSLRASSFRSSEMMRCPFPCREEFHIITASKAELCGYVFPNWSLGTRNKGSIGQKYVIDKSFLIYAYSSFREILFDKFRHHRTNEFLNSLMHNQPSQ